MQIKGPAFLFVFYLFSICFSFVFHFFLHGGLWRIAVTHGFLKAMAFDNILLYFCSFCYQRAMHGVSFTPIEYRWISFLLPSVFYFFFPALLYLSGDTLCLHLLCLARVIPSLHMLCLFRVWDFGHQVGSRESVRMNSICGSHQGKNGLHCHICIAVDFIHIEGVNIYTDLMARFRVQVILLSFTGFLRIHLAPAMVQESCRSLYFLLIVLLI